MPSPTTPSPLILLTCGDPAGIGPEVVVRGWSEPAAHASARLRVVADAQLLTAVLARRGGLPSLPLRVVDEDDPRPSHPNELLVIEPAGEPVDPADLPDGTISAAGGRAAADAVLAAWAAVRGGRADAVVTGPLNKEALHAAGYDVPGHTELLARACGRRDEDASMMLWLPTAGRSGLGVVHVTLHEPLRTAVARITREGIEAAGHRLHRVLERLLADCGTSLPPQDAATGDPGNPRRFLRSPEWKKGMEGFFHGQLGHPPRIAVAALNPHGGEGGLFGDEEPRLIAPAVAALTAAGVAAAGPLPADTLFLRAAAGEFDGVVAMYHDQGHIPIKLLGMHRAVNITLGLPCVRTSVAHGTGFDIVGRGQADPTSLLAAVEAARRLRRSSDG